MTLQPYFRLYRYGIADMAILCDDLATAADAAGLSEHAQDARRLYDEARRISSAEGARAARSDATPALGVRRTALQTLFTTLEHRVAAEAATARSGLRMLATTARVEALSLAGDLRRADAHEAWDAVGRVLEELMDPRYEALLAGQHLIRLALEDVEDAHEALRRELAVDRTVDDLRPAVTALQEELYELFCALVTATRGDAERRMRVLAPFAGVQARLRRAYMARTPNPSRARGASDDAPVAPDAADAPAPAVPHDA